MNCLDTPVVLKQILVHFSNNELLKLSLVNKLWNYEARSVLRDRGDLTAIIRSNQSCLTIIDFAADLDRMCVVPFSRIQLVLPLEPSPCLPNELLLDESCKTIVQRLPCRHLSLHFHDKWEEYSDTPARELVTKMLKGNCEVLKELSVTFCWTQTKMPQDFVRDLSFPRLKKFKLDKKGPKYGLLVESLGPFLKALVSCAPNLEELHVEENINFHEDVLEGSSAVLVPSSLFNPLYERMCKSLVGALRPNLIRMQVREIDQIDDELLNGSVPMVLRASRPTLCTLHMDLLFAVPLMCYEICLEKVAKLVIRIDDFTLRNDLQPRITILLKTFDFTRVFPALNNVTIDSEYTPWPRSFSPDQISAFVDRGNAQLRENLPDRAININQLTFSDSVRESAVPLLAQMFPHVKKLSLSTREYREDIPFTTLSGHFKYLEEFEVMPTGCLLKSKNLDSVFCGIFPEEVAELVEKDDEYLKAVNIVPVMPSISCMKNLRTFTIRYSPKYDTPDRSDPRSILSKLTGLIAFSRCPGLAVTFKIPHEYLSEYAEALDHLRPYASFVTVDVGVSRCSCWSGCSGLLGQA